MVPRMAWLARPVLETVWNDGEFLLSRITDSSATSPMLALSPTFDRPAVGGVTLLEHAYGLRTELDPEFAARPVELIRHDGRPTLLIEDHGGEVLARLLGEAWELESFLRVATGISVALGHLRRRGLIHKDIKPANIFVQVSTGRAWLSGFGLASRVVSERRPPEPPESIEGTLAYMAPEQTGWMNR